MGNIASLTRDGFGTNNYIGYNGNKLTNISGFTNSTYAYDANGNLTNDSQKNISLGYNFLNLPETVSGSQNLTYTYNVAGEKLQKQAGGTTTNYIDGIQYTNNSIDFIQTEEGLARRSGSSYSYEYNLSDHLGNVGVTFYQNPTTNQLEVLQRDDYYAFGLRKEPVAKAGLNKYLYNGKELQEELGQYDYDARFYDPVIGRWNAVDPLAEQYRRLSAYNYAGNNPIRFIDPDGMSVEDKINNEFQASAKAWVTNASFQRNPDGMKPEDIIINGIDQSTQKPAPLIVIKTNQFDIIKNTNIPVPSADVIIHKPIDPLVIDLRRENLKKGEAFMVNLGGDYTIGGGTGGSMQAVFINKGNDKGVYFYRPSTINANIGVNIGAGVTGGFINFNEKSGKALNRFTFEGKSQGWSGGFGAVSLATVLSYSNGKWSMPMNYNKSPVLYSGALAGAGVGGDIGLQYSFTESKLIPALSIPSKK